LGGRETESGLRNTRTPGILRQENPEGFWPTPNLRERRARKKKRKKNLSQNVQSRSIVVETRYFLKKEKKKRRRLRSYFRFQ